MPKDIEISLLCTGCNYKNEPERVYCHNCGVKLDRSALQKAEEKKDIETPEETQMRIQKMMNPHRKRSIKDAKVVLKIIGLSVVVAVLSLFFLTPDNIPPATASIPEQEVGDLWTNAMEAKTSVSITFKTSDINPHLARVLKAKESDIPGYQFDRVFVNCEPGVITITAQRTLWGMPMYNSVSFHPVVKDGAFTAEIIGIHFGRLGVHPTMNAIGKFSIGNVLKAFERDGKNLSRLAEVVVDEGAITFVTKPLP